MDSRAAPRIELRQVSRRFGEFVAVRGLDLTLAPRRIHALIGENGAGKSTALKVVAGLHAPSEGELRLDGEPVHFSSPRDAMAHGIGLVHQHFMLIEPFTALENVILGAEPVRRTPLDRVPFFRWLSRHGAIDFDAARAAARTIAEEAGLEVNLDARVQDLSVGEKQRLEIVRVLFRGARALLLDEPTAVLSPVEVGELYATLRRLADRGHTVAVVTHRLDEVARYADEVTAMRHGERVHYEALTDVAKDSDGLQDRLTRAVMGGELRAEAPRRSRDVSAPEVLVLRSVFLEGTGEKRLHDASLRVSAGEVVGVAGIEGNGQRELTEVLAGLATPARGEVLLDGASPFDGAREASERVRHARSRGLVAVLDDRHRDELLLDATVADNLVLGDLESGDEFARRTRRFERFAVEPHDPSRLGRHLSGGNQQKVVMARVLDRTLRALVLGQPTRGVDVGTARAIHHAVAAVSESGAAVLVVSADLNELRTLCDRILVLRAGTFVAEFPNTASDEEIGRAMLGASCPTPSQSEEAR